MSLAKKVDTTNLSTTRAVSSRRSLFGGAAAVAIGSVITSGAAASAADFISLEPDAGLIRLCAEFVDLEQQYREIYDGPNAVLDDDEAHAATRGIIARKSRILSEMEPMRATTAAGVLALAQALATENGDFGHSFDWPETPPGCLLKMLLRDAAALAGRA